VGIACVLMETEVAGEVELKLGGEPSIAGVEEGM
jgi:hypothetical protein